MEKLKGHWKQESIVIFETILKACEEIEDYEICAKIKANLDYLSCFQGLPYQTEYPYPFETVEDNESIFLRFLPQPAIDNKIQNILREIDKQELNNKPKKKKK